MAKNCEDCVYARVQVKPAQFNTQAKLSEQENLAEFVKISMQDSNVRRVFCSKGEWTTVGGKERFFVSMLAFVSSGISKTAQKCSEYEKVE